MKLKAGDYFRLNEHIQKHLKTTFEYAKVTSVEMDLIKAILVEENEMMKDSVVTIQPKGNTYSFSHYDVAY